jgi:cytochrome-b5 reductase
MGASLTEWMKHKETLPRRWPLGSYTRDEVAQHSTPDDAWLVLYGVVFDITAYIPFHPGGYETLVEYLGNDATAAFREEHAWVNWERLLDACVVGRVVD